jgi:hypothetical protein
MSDKQTIIQELRSAYQEYRDAVDGLDDQQLTTPFLDVWSVRDITGHIVGWHEQFLIGLERMGRGERPSPEGANWGEVQSWNDRFAAQYREADPRVLLTELDGRVEAVVTAIQALPDDRFGEGKTASRMAAGMGYEHFREHAAEVRSARAEGRL